MKLAYFKEKTNTFSMPGMPEVHYYSEPTEGITVIALELDKADLKKLREGPLYIICGPGYKVPPPLQFSIASPFKPLPDGKEEKKGN